MRRTLAGERCGQSGRRERIAAFVAICLTVGAVLPVLAGPQVIGPVERPKQFDKPQDTWRLVQANSLIRATLARSTYGINGNGLTVAVLDTGLRTTHADFAGRVIAQRNFTTDNGGDPTNASDGNGHGTNVGGIICAGSDHTGIAPGASIVPVKILDNSGSGNVSWERQGLDWVIANRALYNITVVNISAGTGANYTAYSAGIDSEGLRSRIQTLRAAKVAVCVSAGNSFFNYSSAQGLDLPAIVPETVSVGAVYDANIGPVTYASGAAATSTAADRICPFSQRLHSSVSAAYRMDIFAPGAAITSSGIASDHGESTMHGTSQASPVTAGAVLLIQQRYLAQNGTLPTVDQIEALLRDNAVTINDGDDEQDNVTNTGLNFPRVDVYASVTAIGGSPSARRPDMLVKSSGVATYNGDGTYNATGSGQTASQTVDAGVVATYHLRLQNDGTSSDTMGVTGTAGGAGWAVAYYDATSGGSLVTSSVTGAGWSVVLAAGAAKDFRVEVTPDETVAGGGSDDVLVTATSTGDATKADTVKAATSRTAGGDDAFEPDGMVAQAKVITVGGAAQSHTIQPADDQDWAKFSAVTGTTYTIATGPHTGQAGMDTFLELYDPAGTKMVASDDDGGTDLFSLITWTSPATGTYNVKVRGYSSTTTGHYDLTVTGPGAAFAPDMLVRNSGDASYLGDGVYNADGTGQSKAQTAASGVAAVYALRLENDGGGSDSFKVKGTAGDANWTVRYYSATSAGTEVTSQVTSAAGWSAGMLAAGAAQEFRVEVTPLAGAAAGSSRAVLVTGTSVGDAGQSDTVKATTTKQAAATHVADMLIKTSAEATYTGNSVYNSTGVGQTKALTKAQGAKAVYGLRLDNDGTVTKTLIVNGTAGGTAWTVRYYNAAAGGTEVTSQVIRAAGWSVPLAAGAKLSFRVEVAPQATAPVGAVKSVLVTAKVSGTPTDTDTVKATTTRGASGGAATVSALAAARGGGGAEIVVTLSSEADVSVSVLNLAGVVVRRLCEDASMPRGTSVVLWDGRSSRGSKAPSGRYLVRVTTRGGDGWQAEQITGFSVSR